MEAEKSSTPDTSTVQTDLEAMTLSDEDRALFLRMMGLRPGVSAEEAAEVRAEWPDKDILMAIGSGLFKLVGMKLLAASSLSMSTPNENGAAKQARVDARAEK